jgi:hypothetical protein
MSEIDSKPKNKPMGYVLVVLAIVIPVFLFSAVQASLGSGTIGENMFGVLIAVLFIAITGVLIRLTTRK